MPIDGPYEPSPWAPIADQVALYESSGGTEGTLLEGQPCVILWTKGRRTGAVRKTLALLGISPSYAGDIHP